MPLSSHLLITTKCCLRAQLSHEYCLVSLCLGIYLLFFRKPQLQTSIREKLDNPGFVHLVFPDGRELVSGVGSQPLSESLKQAVGDVINPGKLSVCDVKMSYLKV